VADVAVARSGGEADIHDSLDTCSPCSSNQDNTTGEDMIHVLAVVTAKPGKREEILKAIRANLPAVRAEKGCIEYGPAVDAEDIGPFQTKAGADAIFVIEKWSDADALRAHAAAPHMAAYGAKVKDLVASRVIYVLKPAD
jgi:quinol monooxygenase YgiN